MALCPDRKSGRSRRIPIKAANTVVKVGKIRYVCQCMLVEECFIVVQVLLFEITDNLKSSVREDSLSEFAS